MSNACDVIFIADFRLTGDTGLMLAREIAATVAVGYRCGLLHVRSPVVSCSHPVNPVIRGFVERGDVDLLDPAATWSAGLCLIHQARTLTFLPITPLRVRADQKRLLIDRPLSEGDGGEPREWKRIDRNAQEIFGGDVIWTPTSPFVREQVGSLFEPPSLAKEDWTAVIDVDGWRRDVEAAREHPGGDPAIPVVGRHGSTDPLAWPDNREALFNVFPPTPDIGVRISGDRRMLAALARPFALPAHWQIFEGEQLGSCELLRNIDIFAYYHGQSWVEGTGMAVLEALAAGRLTVLPPHFEAMFGPAAVYGEAASVKDVIQHYRQSPEFCAEQQKRADAVLRERFGQPVYARRIEALIGKPAPKAVGGASLGGAPALPGGRKRVIFMSSNGVGMGHMTRQLAIARRLNRSIEPIFLTLSQAARHIESFGYPVEYIPSHGYLDCDVDLWNRHLRYDLAHRLDFYEPSVMVFDGNAPYGGMMRALEARPGITTVWCRRAMWRPGAGSFQISREEGFDVVLEPGELAGELDRGLTRDLRGRTFAVDPIRLFDQADMLDRSTARDELGLPRDKRIVLLQLGSGNNFDHGRMLGAILSWLTEQPDLEIVWLDWTIATNKINLPENVRRLDVYPIVRHLHAFDTVISAAGYNAYHELLLSGVPTVFVPNEGPMMDDQLGRSIYAQLHGLGECLRRHEIYRVETVLQHIHQPDVQISIRQKCAAIDDRNGALDAAHLIEDLAFSSRADLDHADDFLPALRRI